MTALQLLLIISAAILLQVAMGVAVALWRRHADATLALPSDGSVVQAASAAAWPGWRDFRVTRRTFEDAAMSQCSFYLQPVDGKPLPDFKPGQYLTVSLPAGEDAGSQPQGGTTAMRSLIRCYSLSDAPDPVTYRVTVKRALPPADRPEVPPGVASNYLHNRVREGAVLPVKAPAGHFFIDPDATAPAVFIAGGIGITPMVSMLRWCLAMQPQRAVHLYYGVRNSADHAFKSVLESLAAEGRGFKLHVIYSNPAPEDILGRDYQHVGYVNLSLLQSTLGHGRHQFYVCGPPPMMQSLVPALRGWGVPEDDIHYEAFGPATVLPDTSAINERLADAAVSWGIRLSRSGRTLVWEGQDANLLDFLERQGVAVDSGCRTGSCGACETPLAAGTVDYAEKPDYDVAPGRCLLCVGKPKSAMVLEL